MVLVPLYQSELAPPKIRGLLVGMHGVCICIGYALSSWVGLGFYFVSASGAQWRIPLAIQCAAPLVLACGVLFLPESPRWRKWIIKTHYLARDTGHAAKPTFSSDAGPRRGCLSCFRAYPRGQWDELGRFNRAQSIRPTPRATAPREAEWCQSGRAVQAPYPPETMRHWMVDHVWCSRHRNAGDQQYRSS